MTEKINKNKNLNFSRGHVAHRRRGRSNACSRAFSKVQAAYRIFKWSQDLELDLDLDHGESSGWGEWFAEYFLGIFTGGL
ncbi:hypothetical protein [Delftia sp. PE138]|uniref:hypothetical protein n=1 Tax=Delftia sp. PE138 TaxID=1812483 RepID=UPI001BB0BB4D|nr:hypothetical protein [Delftia sp. PE138]